MIERNKIIYNLSSLNKVPTSENYEDNQHFNKLREEKKKMTTEFSVPFWKVFFLISQGIKSEPTNKRKLP